MQIKDMIMLEKLLASRVEILNSGLEKTGYNEFSQFYYFELRDIVPIITALQVKYNYICVTSFDPDVATLTLINLDNTEDQIVFTSPMSTAKLKASHEVQNLGAVQTYIRRYLYQMAFDITDGDVLDATSGKDDSPPTQQKQARKPAPRKTQARQAPPKRTQQKPKQAAASGTITTKQAEDLWADAVKIWGDNVARDCIKDMTRQLGVKSIRDVSVNDLKYAQEYVSSWSA